MAKVQGKKAMTAGKKAAKKVVARVKSAVKAKVAPKKAAPASKTAAKKPAAKSAAKPAAKAKPQPKSAVKAVAKKAAKSVAKPAKKAPAKVKVAAKAVVRTAKKVAAKAARPVAKAVAAAPKAKAEPKGKAKSQPKLLPKAVPPPPARTAPVATPPPPAAARAPEPEKKRGRRARPRIHSDGSPAANWLSTEKPRPASFIPAPPRAEAPSAVAAPPASSDRLIRPDDIDHPAVRTVPIRIDVEQGAGRYYVIASPMEVSIRPGEGIEWDFRYLGGADVSVEEIVVEFEKPSPFTQTVFRTRKPGGARPHRQMSGGALPAAAGRRVQYVVRAFTPFKTELANTKIAVNVTT